MRHVTREETVTIRRTRWWLASVLVATFALAGCGGAQHDNASSSSGSNAKAPAPAEGGAGDAAAPPNKEGAGAGPAQQVPDNLPDTRSIIYTGTISLRVPKVDDAALKVSAAAEQAGGFVGSEDRTSESGNASAKMTLRVPSAKFSTVLNSLRALVDGAELSRQVSTEDVTEQVADVEARLANAQASVDRVRALMAKAQTIGEITSLEAELSRREGDLESLQARKRKLDDVTTLSTITVLLFAPPAPAKPVKPEEKGFVAGLKAGWSSFVSSMQVLLTVIGALLPWLAALAIVGLVVWLPIRRALRRRPPRPAVAVAGPAPMMPASTVAAPVPARMPPPAPARGPAPTTAPEPTTAPPSGPTTGPASAPPPSPAGPPPRVSERPETGPPPS
jgi:hypothetical protein